MPEGNSSKVDHLPENARETALARLPGGSGMPDHVHRALGVAYHPGGVGSQQKILQTRAMGAHDDLIGFYLLGHLQHLFLHRAVAGNSVDLQDDYSRTSSAIQGHPVRQDKLVEDWR